ncbi:MAG: glycosyltransferase family 2 protein [Candidatus Hydrogenedentes bacterium]|nr:glycosyltransferase family 2 protein [Candidatus Hydrogenedentota bacterium]
MRKLIIQIPCYNEAETIGITLDALPREVPGVDVVEWLVIDDGSADNTAEIAAQHGADHVIRFRVNRGLARAFTQGLDFCIRSGADIIVNTDADNQYNADDIPRLIAPILAGEAEIVIGARPISTIEHFSFMKKVLQRLGSWVVRLASGTEIADAPSGFRAMTRDAALSLNVFDNYTYTLETIIQAGRKNISITSVPVRTNEDLRPSRLVRSIPSYVQRSLFTIVRIFMTYRPFRFFALPGFVLFVLGLIPSVRYVYYHFSGQGGGHIPSLIAAAILISLGAVLILMGLLADLIGINRMLLEDIRRRLRDLEYRDHTRRFGR